MNQLLERLSWRDAQRLMEEHPIVLIPVGSTEQHGPHLPLGTDFLTAKALAEAAAEATGALCTPVIPIGVSEHHRQFWGTLSVSPAAFRGYLAEVAESLGGHGLRRLIFVNGHGGNSPSLQEVARDLRPKGIFAAIWSWWLDPAVQALFEARFRSRGSHAGAGETSMICHIDPDLVQRDAFDEAAEGASETFGRMVFGAQLPLDTCDFSQSGATLDPREGSAEAGEEIFTAAQAQLEQLIVWLRDASGDELVPKAHRP